MRQFNIFKNTKGWLSLYERALHFRHMRNQEEVKRRVKILTFWKKHGLEPTKEAFNVGERTLYRWQSVLNQSKGRLESLDPKSTVPKKKRKRVVLPEVEDFIVRTRKKHPGLGKKKMVVLLNKEGYALSESYVGRVIHDLKERGVLSNEQQLSFYARIGKHNIKQKSKRKKVRRTHKRGMEVDTIIRFIDGSKRYILTAVDTQNRFVFAGAYTTHSSANAADFLTKLTKVCPYPLTEVQTDNGSEFALRFREACEKLSITHYHTYPRSPKMNAHIERFNRTLSEDFIVWNKSLLRDNIHAFNEKLVDWLLWYNGERPHESLSMLSPLSYIVSTLQVKDCHKWWTRTCV